MTDEKLIAMARLAQRDERMSTGALYGDLADRIEVLERSRKDLEKLSIKLINEKLHGEWSEPLVAELEAAEAKLAKAVEALEDIKRYSSCGDTRRKAIETLAEIKGENHE